MTTQQGDITRIEDVNGNVLATYEYDAWGKLISSSGSLAEINPLRHRGYYYDTETGFYYLQSRYYDPVVSRFINADRYASTGDGIVGYNMFAYCDNNPINRLDETGEIWNFVAGALLGTASVYIGDVINNVITGKSGWDILKPTSSVGTYLGAAVSGMIPGAGLGSALLRATANTGTKYITDAAVYRDYDMASLGTDAFINTATELLAPKVSNLIRKAGPRSYSSFKHQITRVAPNITRQQTYKVMYIANRAIDATIAVAQIILNALPSIQIR